MEISGHNQVYQHVLTNFERTNDFIEENQENNEMTNEIKEKITQDLSSTLVLILDNMGRQKAIQALEIYREHEKFRKKLEEVSQDPTDPAPAQHAPENPEPAPDKGLDSEEDDGFLNVPDQVDVELKQLSFQVEQLVS